MTAQAIRCWPATTGLPMTNDPDQTLVERTKHGEVEAFSALVLRHQNAVYGLAFRFMRDPTAAEDMAQEAFLKAFRLLKGFRGKCAFSTWLYQVTCSVCLTELSRRKRRGEVALRPGHPEESVRPSVESEDAKELIRRCVARLPERYATVVTLYYLNEVTYDEIAALMCIPLGTLKTWMHRARKQLRRIVEEEMAGSRTNEAG